MSRSNEIEFRPEVFLLCFEDAFNAGIILQEEGLSIEKIIFRGGVAELLRHAELFALRIDFELYKDYYYNSNGFEIASRSIQSAIWSVEDKMEKYNSFNYFIVYKKLRN